MDILVMRNGSFYSEIVKEFTNSDYTHVAGVIDDNVYDFCVNGKQIRNLEDYLNSQKLLNLDCIRDVDIDPEEFKNRFEDAKYETTRGLMRLAYRLPDSRDETNIATSDNHYTCASLLGKSFESPHHYSQTIPSDFINHRS